MLDPEPVSDAKGGIDASSPVDRSVAGFCSRVRPVSPDRPRPLAHAHSGRYTYAHTHARRFEC